MNDRYHVFKQGRKRGPFSIEELLSEVENGHCEYQDWCLRIGSVTCGKIRDVLDWEDGPFLHEAVSKGSRSSEPMEEAVETEQDDGGEPAIEQDGLTDADGDDDDFDDDFGGENGDGDDRQDGEDFVAEDSKRLAGNNDYFSEQEFDFDYSEPAPEDGPGEDDDFLEESDDEWEATGPRPIPNNLPPADPMAILYSGRPSILSFPKSLLLTLLSLAAGIYFRGHYEWALSAGIASAVIIFVIAQLRCMKFQFFIRPRHIEVIHGLLLRNSREVCIEDIGAIHIRRRGLRGLLGLETIEFASIESPMIVLVFHNIRSARRIKSLVRRLQEVLESQR